LDFFIKYPKLGLLGTSFVKTREEIQSRDEKTTRDKK